MEQTDFGMIEPKVELEIIDENEAGKNLPVKEEILKLQDQVNNDQRFRENILKISNEIVIGAFNSAVEDLDTNANEDVMKSKTVNFLFHSFRNSEYLDVTEEVLENLSPLTNLALSLDILEGFIKFLDQNSYLEQCLVSVDVNMDELLVLREVVYNSVNNGEQFVLDTSRVTETIVYYHSIRNKVLTHVCSKLFEVLQEIPDNEEAELLGTIMCLPWNQVVIAFEAKFSQHYMFPQLSSKLESLMMMEMMETKYEDEQFVEQFDMDPPLDPVTDTTSQNYFKQSRKLHMCDFCEYRTPKISNIKTHLKGKHRHQEIPVGSNGFTTMNREGDLLLNYKPRPRRKGPDYKSKIHHCNVCEYSSNKMSNIKSHVKNKHFFTNPSEGYTTRDHDNDSINFDQGNNLQHIKRERTESQISATILPLKSIDEENFQQVKEERLGALPKACARINSQDKFKTNPITAHNTHMIQPKETLRKMLQCNNCDYVSNKTSNMKAHVKNVHRSVKFAEGDSGYVRSLWFGDRRVGHSKKLVEIGFKQTKNHSPDKQDLNISHAIKPVQVKLTKLNVHRFVQLPEGANYVSKIQEPHYSSLL